MPSYKVHVKVSVLKPGVRLRVEITRIRIWNRATEKESGTRSDHWKNQIRIRAFSNPEPDTQDWHIIWK